MAQQLTRLAVFEGRHGSSATASAFLARAPSPRSHGQPGSIRTLARRPLQRRHLASLTPTRSDSRAAPDGMPLQHATTTQKHTWGSRPTMGLHADEGEDGTADEVTAQEYDDMRQALAVPAQSNHTDVLDTASREEVYRDWLAVMESPGATPKPDSTEHPSLMLAAEPAKSFQNLVDEAVGAKDRGRLLEMLRHVVPDELASIPPAKFSQVIRVLHPNAFFPIGDPLGDKHSRHPLAHPTYVDIPGRLMKQHNMIYDRETFVDFLDSYSQTWNNVLVSRAHSGMKLSALDYARLLEYAALVGNEDLSETIWKDMRSNGIRPSVDCWNARIQAKIFNQWLNPWWRRLDRSSGYHMYARTGFQPFLPKASSSRHSGYRVGDNGIKEQVTSMVFSHLMADGSRPNERTYCLLIAAIGREADWSGIESILQSVWRINVNELMAPQNQDKSPDQFNLKTFPDGSALQPTSKLLQTIAQAYGSGAKLNVALRLVDVISRKYSIKIPDHVWETLLFWTYIHSRIRLRKRAWTVGGPRAAHPFTFDGIWTVMTSAPHNVTPTLRMYDIYAHSHFDRERYLNIAGVIRDAIPLYNRIQRHAQRRKKSLDTAIARQGSPDPYAPDSTNSSAAAAPFEPGLTSIHDLRRWYHTSELARQIARHRIRSWVTRLMSHRHSTPHRSGPFRALTHFRLLPDVLADLPPKLLPPRITVRTLHGRLEIDTGSASRLEAIRLQHLTNRSDELGTVVRSLVDQGRWVPKYEQWLRSPDVSTLDPTAKSEALLELVEREEKLSEDGGAGEENEERDDFSRA